MTNQSRVLRVLLMAAFLLLILWLMGCDRETTFYVGAKFYAVNNTEEGLHVYLNSIFQFSLGPGQGDEVDDLDEGEYTAAARRESDGAVVKEEEVYLHEREKFRWEIR
ncbi:MAG TPA: hypothetical protein VM163_04645 [bacterium]|nr:hypothetical protein [bacterium]